MGIFPTGFPGETQSGSASFPDNAFGVNLFNDTISCPQSGAIPAFEGQISADLNGIVTGSVNYTVNASGFLSSLSFSDIELAVDINTTINGALSIKADIIVSIQAKPSRRRLRIPSHFQGNLSTGQIQLFTVGLPGLDFGKIFTLGPTLTIYGEADASIEANLALDVDFSYTTSDLQFTYPQSQGANGSFTPGDSSTSYVVEKPYVLTAYFYPAVDANLSAGPNVTADMQLSAHVVPEITFGLSILEQTANIYVSLDAFAEADLSLTAAAGASTSTNGSSSTSTGAGGCVDIFAGFSVNLGADAELLGISDGRNDTLYSKSWDLYKECFGNQYQARDDSPGIGSRVPLSFFEQNLRKDHRQFAFAALAAVASSPSKDSKGFSCPTTSTGALAPILAQTFSAAR